MIVEPRLQPLRIPGGWHLGHYNWLYEIDPPLPQSKDSESLAKFFCEDLVYLTHDERNRLLDVGWYPNENLDHGAYTIYVHEGDFWGPELHCFSTRDRAILVAEIERLLCEISRGAL